MATYLFAWELGGGSGHCVDLLPAVERAVAEGHAVVAAMRDLHAARRVFGALPLRYLQAPQLREWPQSLVRDPRTFAHLLHNCGYGSDAQFAPLVAAWRTIFELVRPDAVVCDHSPTALLTGRILGIPAAVIGTGFFIPPDLAPLPDLALWHPPLTPERLRKTEAPILDRINCTLSGVASPPIESVSKLYADAKETFLLTFREIDHCRDWRDGEYYGLWSPRGGVPPEWPSGNGPRVYAYLNPAMRAWKPASFVDAVRSLDIACLVYAPQIEPELLSRLKSPNVRFESKRIDMDALCAQADVAVSHGSNGTSTRFLLGGVPQLHLPLNLEQALFAYRIAETGASLFAEVGRPDLISSQLLSLIQQDPYRARARDFAKRYAEFDADASAARVAERICRLHKRDA